MKRLTILKTTRILKALCRENTKPLQKFMCKILADEPFRGWDDVEVLLLKSIEAFCMQHGFIQEAQQLIAATGFNMLLERPDSAFQTAMDLVQKGEEGFVIQAFNGIGNDPTDFRLSEDKSKLLMRVAARAEELGKTEIAIAVYSCALRCDAYFDEEDTHPLLYAARNNRLLADAYRKVFDTCYHLRYTPHKKGYFEELVKMGDCYCLRIGLECGGNVHCPTADGRSLWNIAHNDEVCALLEEFGGKPGERNIYLLRQAILALERGEVDHEAMKELFSEENPLVEYKFYETTFPNVAVSRWNLVQTAAECRSLPALKYMLPHLKNCSDNELDNLLMGLLYVDTYRTLMTEPENQESAAEIIEILEWLHANGISYKNPWQRDTEPFFRMTPSLNSKVGRILNIACINFWGKPLYPEEDMVKIAMVMWKLANIYDTEAGAREMMLWGIYHQLKGVLDACMAEFRCDFSVLDTHETSAAWAIVGNEYCDEGQAEELLEFALENGADINHQTTSGTALHAAYQFGNTMEFDPVILLLKAGADPTIRDSYGRRPKDMPKRGKTFLDKVTHIMKGKSDGKY